MSYVDNRFSELLARKERLERRNITREMVSQETGISITSVQNWASNRISRFDGKQIATFCNYFNCSISDLLVISGTEEYESFSEESETSHQLQVA